MTTATHKGTIDELRKLVDEMPVKASARGLVPLAAVPEPGTAHVLLEDDPVNADDFLDLARTCGARILYYDHDVFTAEAFVVLEDDDPLADGPTAEESLSPDDARQLRKLRRTATRHEGHVTTVTMCFMAEGLLHLWIARAAWHTQLAAERDLFLAEHASAQDTRVEDAHVRREAERQRIAAELADNREFRGPPSAATARTSPLSPTRHLPPQIPANSGSTSGWSAEQRATRPTWSKAQHAASTPTSNTTWTPSPGRSNLRALPTA
ncbi:hypothetical protein ACWGAN_07965 [Streptomyces sp. NPDC054945]